MGTKKEIVDAMASRLNLSKASSKVVLNEVLDIMSEQLAKDGSLQLTNFGSFTVKDMKAREGRNPRNQEEVIMIEARKQAFFRAGKSLKEKINK